MNPKVLLAITGTTGAGKTTFVSSLTCPKLFIGSELRVKYGESYFIKQKNSGAPPSMDVEIENMVIEFLEMNSHATLLAIESLPRSTTQLLLLNKIKEFGWLPIVLFIDAPKEVRLERVSRRDHTKEMNELSVKRINEEDYNGLVKELKAIDDILFTSLCSG